MSGEVFEMVMETRVDNLEALVEQVEGRVNCPRTAVVILALFWWFLLLLHGAHDKESLRVNPSAVASRAKKTGLVHVSVRLSVSSCSKAGSGV